MNSSVQPGISSAASGIRNGDGEGPSIRALYSPSRGQVGCVLIQAAYGGDGRASRIFDARDWFVAPVDDMTWITAPAADWEFVAGLPLAERQRLPIPVDTSDGQVSPGIDQK